MPTIVVQYETFSCTYPMINADDGVPCRGHSCDTTGAGPQHSLNRPAQD